MQDDEGGRMKSLQRQSLPHLAGRLRESLRTFAWINILLLAPQKHILTCTSYKMFLSL